MKKKLKVVCLTGGPCAGKTAITAIIKRQFARELHVVPESASILYKGGFPRSSNAAEMKCVQQAIYHVQSSSEALAKIQLAGVQALVCDRGTLDGAAYWPQSRAHFCRSMGSHLKKEFSRYDIVIHLETANEGEGYESDNTIRTESAREAQALDRKIQKAWEGHPRRFFVSSRASFLEKIEEVLTLLRREFLPQDPKGIGK
jgi:hypothetical protein